MLIYKQSSVYQRNRKQKCFILWLNAQSYLSSQSLFSWIQTKQIRVKAQELGVCDETEDNLFPCLLPPQRVKGFKASCSLSLHFMDLSQPGFTFLIIPFQSCGRDQILLGSLVASNANLEKGKSNQILPKTVRFIPFAGNKELLMFDDCLEKIVLLNEINLSWLVLRIGSCRQRNQEIDIASRMN